MPANKGGESKQGLIITLVCFILLSIILAVTTYYGYSEQAAFQAAAKKEKDDAASMKKQRDWYQFLALQLKGYSGYLTKQESGDLPVLRENYRSGGLTGDDKAAYDNLFKELKERLIKDKELDPKADRTAETFESFKEKMIWLEGELKNNRASLKQEQTSLAKERANYALLMDVRNKELQDTKANLQKALADNVANQQKMEQDLQTRLQEFGNLSDDLAKTKKKADTDVQNLGKEKAKLSAEIKDQEAAREKLQRQLTPPDLQKFSSPKGNIVSVDPRGQLAWINLGSADNVRTQQGLTFSVFGHGIAGRGSTERKGALEVVNVLGPHFSLAKITETVDPRNNPIQTEDVLVNPAWSPGMQGHVAIAGLIDFTGEGRDHIDEFMRGLKKQDVVVDAYLDLKDATVKGKMDLKTDYLILGESPEINANTTIREGDTRFDRKTEILDKMAGMQNEAQRLGVTAVPLRRFVALTGYQLPRGARSTTGLSYESRIPPPAANGEAKVPGKKEKAKEEKKDEGK